MAMTDFLKLINAMFDFKRAVPEMRWDVAQQTWGESTLTIVIPISDEVAKTFIQGTKMFEPVD